MITKIHICSKDFREDKQVKMRCGYLLEYKNSQERRAYTTYNFRRATCLVCMQREMFRIVKDSAKLAKRYLKVSGKNIQEKTS